MPRSDRRSDRVLTGRDWVRPDRMCQTVTGLTNLIFTVRRFGSPVKAFVSVHQTSEIIVRQGCKTILFYRINNAKDTEEGVEGKGLNDNEWIKYCI